MPHQNTLSKLPGTEQFLDRLVDDIRQRRSVIVAVPTPFEKRSLRSLLRFRLLSLDLDVQDVSLALIGEDKSPVAVLSQVLGIEWETSESRTPAALVSRLPSGPAPLDAIQVIGVEDLSASERASWLQLFEFWGQTSLNLLDQGQEPVVLFAVVPVSSSDELPQTSTHLAVHWLWGMTSALEARLFCRLKQRGEPLESDARWREYILSSLAAGDIDVIEFMWDDACLDVPKLTQRLVVFAENRGWKDADFLDIDVGALLNLRGHQNNNSRLSQSPPPDGLSLWARGAVYTTVEYGIEIHPSILALRDMTEQIVHRVWRGQAELVLPLIDQVRLRLCDHLTRQYGEDWTTKWGLPDSAEQQEAIKDSPYAAEWGYLDWLLKSRSELRAESNWTSVASSARRLRNQIAHYQPVRYPEFERFLGQVQFVLNGTAL